MNKNKVFLVIGLFSSFFGLLGFLINYLFLENNPVLAFFTGFLIGLAFVLNLAYLIRLRKGK